MQSIYERLTAPWPLGSFSKPSANKPSSPTNVVSWLPTSPTTDATPTKFMHAIHSILGTKRPRSEGTKTIPKVARTEAPKIKTIVFDLPLNLVTGGLNPCYSHDRNDTPAEIAARRVVVAVKPRRSSRLQEIKAN